MIIIIQPEETLSNKIVVLLCFMQMYDSKHLKEEFFNHTNGFLIFFLFLHAK